VRALALVDLDDTLFQTLRKCPPDVPAERLLPIGFDRDGAALSYATPRQASFLAWLSETALLIPVTARSRDALERVRIPWERAICAHGGVILNDRNSPDAAWRSYVEGEARACTASLEALEARVLEEGAGQQVAARILREEGTPLYLLVKHKDGDAAILAETIGRVSREVPPGWTVHSNGNNAAFLPPYLGKHRAVEWLLPELRRRYPDSPILGIGDSLTDAPYMRLCDFAVIPARSQLGERAFANLS
jgi:hypothetical protein